MKHAGNFVLKGKEPVEEPDLIAWAMWFESACRDGSRMVAQTDVAPGVSVSTVFLGTDHNFFGKGPPLLFETMVFRDDGPSECYRWSTWATAEVGHIEEVDRLRDLLKDVHDVFTVKAHD